MDATNFIPGTFYFQGTEVYVGTENGEPGFVARCDNTPWASLVAQACNRAIDIVHGVITIDPELEI